MITTFYRDGTLEYRNYLDERNERLLSFFHLNGISNIRIIGNAEDPGIIYKNEVRLSCYVKEMNLILLDGINGEVISTLALNTPEVLNAEGLLIDFVENIEHRKVWKIMLKEMYGLFLTGYNYMDRKIKQGKYPVFATMEPRIFMSKENALDIISHLPEYNLKVI